MLLKNYTWSIGKAMMSGEIIGTHNNGYEMGFCFCLGPGPNEICLQIDLAQANIVCFPLKKEQCAKWNEWMVLGGALAANCRGGKAAVTTRGRQVVVPTDRQTKDVLPINTALLLSYSRKRQAWSKSQAYNFTTLGPSHNWVTEGWELCCLLCFVAMLQWLWATMQWVKDGGSVYSQGTSCKLEMGTQAFSNAPLSSIPFGIAGRARGDIRTNLGCDFVAICVTLWYKSLPVHFAMSMTVSRSHISACSTRTLKHDPG